MESMNENKPQETEELPEEPKFQSGVADDSFVDENEDMNEAEQDDELEENRKRKFPVGLFAFLGILIVLIGVIVFLYKNVYPVVQAELGTGLPEASEFTRDGSEAFYLDPPEVSLSEEQAYLIKLNTVDGIRFSLMFVRDTQAPTADDAHAVVSMESRLDPYDAVTNVYDALPYLARWKTEPSYSQPGETQGEVELIDANRNSSVIPVTVTVIVTKQVLEWESGTTMPTVRSFLAVSRGNASIVTDLSEIDSSVLGDYPVEIQVDGNVYQSILRIVDTTAPQFECTSKVISIGTIPDAAELVVDCTDCTKVTYAYAEEPDTSVLGDISCTIVATDEGGNTSSCVTTLSVYDAVLNLEASASGRTAADLLAETEYHAAGNESDTVIVPAGFIGIKTVELESAEGTKSVYLKVSDTVAPKADAVAVEGYAGYELSADSFVENVSDGTQVEISFAAIPDWNKTGEQKVTVKLSDAAENETLIETTLNMEKDETAPVIFGAVDRVCYVGDSVNYKENLLVYDNADTAVTTANVDKSEVDEASEGTYEVTYSAEDRDGNRTEVTVSYEFIEPEVSNEDITALTEKILGEIITDDMTLAQKVQAVYNYVSSTIRNTDKSDGIDWKKAAYTGLTTGKGDYFTAYSAEYLLLKALDCNVMPIKGIGESEGAYWCLVNIGTGWYHFDAFNVGYSAAPLFMWCPADLTEGVTREYDESIYPEIANVSFSIDE